METVLIAIDGQATERDGEVGLNLTRVFNTIMIILIIIIILLICYYVNDGHEERSGCGCGGRDNRMDEEKRTILLRLNNTIIA